MAQHLHLFETENEFQDKRDNNYSEPWVSYTEENGKVVYNKSEEEREYERMLSVPLTFEALTSGDITFYRRNTAYTLTIEYQKNGGNWTQLSSGQGNGNKVNVVAGDVVSFRGNNKTYTKPTNIGYYNKLSASCECNVYGNIMSLIDSVNFSGLTELEEISGETCTFYCFFANSKIVDASMLRLPARVLSTRCYDSMFQSNTLLKKAPKLPASSLTWRCYDRMFNYCYSLEVAPALPATTLASECYQEMFGQCSGLTQAPVLPAATLVSGCYKYMFSGCSSLNQITCLATDMSATECLKNWVSGVAASGTFVKKSGVTWPSGNSGIPDGWIVEEV